MLSNLSTECEFAVYAYNKDIIPTEELLNRVEKLEQLSLSFCKDLKESSDLTLSMLEVDDFDLAAKSLTKIKELNGLAYNKSLLMDQLCIEIDAMMGQ
jgi:hypothetical protein